MSAFNFYEITLSWTPPHTAPPPLKKLTLMVRTEREEVVVALSTPFFTEDKDVSGRVSPDSIHYSLVVCMMKWKVREHWVGGGLRMGIEKAKRNMLFKDI